MSRTVAIVVVALVTLTIEATVLPSGGYSDVEVGIAGGKNATPGQFPWHVKLIITANGTTFLGGASLITPTVVITAAHCVNWVSPDVTVIGGLKWVDPPSTVQRRKADKFKIHPKIFGQCRDDIALIKLKAPFDIKASNGTIGTVNLPPRNHEVNGEVVVTGWGRISDTERSTTLRYATIPVVDDSVCATRFPCYTEKKLCAGGGGRGICPGDSGGGAVEYTNKSAVLVGISSGGGGGCGKIPAYFVRVSSYLDWINSNSI
ncbi:tryptase beta-2-like [Ornithodoros turicata]|uniref:tryptase beta-2-like n=1 Tax=Ornithodoros turicata TaxID=34597 RepID=UPI003139AB3D